jgi:hypothetical protein
MGASGSGAVLGSGAKRKRAHKQACGVPSEHCTGGLCGVSNGLKKAGKLHSSPQEAFACYAKYLIKQGYTQVGPREFYKGDGPIVVLTKKSRFGARCRGGKADRQMPSTDATGGHIISC